MSKLMQQFIDSRYMLYLVEAGEWLQFVKTETERRGFAFRAHHLDLELGPDFEARARKARYDAVMSEVEQGDVVMTAHHRDDQVETLLIRLSQGSGLIGLAGIPVTRPFGLGVLIRPLLSLSRLQLKHVLGARNLRHVVDPRNRLSFHGLGFLGATYQGLGTDFQ